MTAANEWQYETTNVKSPKANAIMGIDFPGPMALLRSCMGNSTAKERRCQYAGMKTMVVGGSGAVAKGRRAGRGTDDGRGEGGEKGE
jgi:hypothetical protein